MASSSSTRQPSPSADSKHNTSKPKQQQHHRHQEDPSIKPENNPSPPQFEFIGHDAPDGSRVRSHVMRGSWRARKLKASQKAAQRSNQEVRILAKKEDSHTTSQLSGDSSAGPSSSSLQWVRKSDESISSSTSPSMTAGARRKSAASLSRSDRRTQSRSPRYNFAHPQAQDRQHHHGAQRHSPSTSAYSSHMTDSPPTPSLGLSIDPLSMAPFELTPEDRALYQWRLNSYTSECLDSDLMASVCVYVDLSCAASLHATLAYVSAHLAQLRGEAIPLHAIKHKVESIRLMNERLSDPILATDDATIAGVLKQLTFESRFGTEEARQTHYDGLARILELRGGMGSFRENWKLECAIHVTLMISPPTWFTPAPTSFPSPPGPISTMPTFHPSSSSSALTSLELSLSHSSLPIPFSPSPHLSPSITTPSLQRGCTDFASFFRRLRSASAQINTLIELEAPQYYPYLAAMLRHLLDDYPVSFDGAEHGDRRQCLLETFHMALLLWIAVVLVDAMATPGQDLDAEGEMDTDYTSDPDADFEFAESRPELAILNALLHHTGKSVWSRSLATLAILVNQKIKVVDHGADAPNTWSCMGIRDLTKAQCVLRLLDVAKRVRLGTWREIKTWLVEVVCGGEGGSRAAVESRSGGEEGNLEVVFDGGLLLMEVMGAVGR